MTGKNHIALALAVPLALEMGQPWLISLLPTSVAAWGCLIIGSLAPDIDGEGAIARWGNFLPRHITPKPVVRLLNWAGRTVSSLIRAILGHRNALHWPLWGVLMMLCVAWLPTVCQWLPAACSLQPVAGLLFWFGLGYVLHIFGDSLTKSGVPLLGPIWTRDISFLPMITGSRLESFVGLLLWLFVAWRLAATVVSPELLHQFS